MSDKLGMAKVLMNGAANTIFKDRPGVHGDTENSFDMIADFWSVYINHTRIAVGIAGPRVQLSGVDVANMMAQLKQCRFVYGNRSNPDNFVDGIGYTALAGQLALSGTQASGEEYKEVK